MSGIWDHSQNLILKAGAEAYGHRFVQTIQTKPDWEKLACEDCGKLLWVLCEEAQEDVKKNGMPSRCSGKEVVMEQDTTDPEPCRMKNRGGSECGTCECFGPMVCPNYNFKERRLIEDVEKLTIGVDTPHIRYGIEVPIPELISIGCKLHVPKEKEILRCGNTMN